jgi:hypothetical protein
MAPSDDTTPTTGPTAEDCAAMKQMLEAFKCENEELHNRQVNLSNAKLGCKPERYDGSRKPLAVDNWVKTLDDYLELNPSQRVTDRMVVLTAASYLAEHVKSDYNAYTAKHGEFETWLQMKKWLLDTYNPVDPVNTYTVHWFYNLRQRTSESPDAYYCRFLDATTLLPQPMHEMYVNFHFAHTLLPYYQ